MARIWKSANLCYPCSDGCYPDNGFNPLNIRVLVVIITWLNQKGGKCYGREESKSFKRKLW